jgi:hypothetical protein
MIKNEQGLKSSQEAIAYLRKMLEAPIKEGIPEIVAKAARGHVQEQIDEIQKEIQEYLDLKKGLCPERKNCNFTYRKACPIQCCDGCPRERECTIKCFFVLNKKSG